MADVWDIEELALRATGLSSEAAEEAINDNVDLDEVLYDAYEISFEQYQKIVNDLLPFTSVVQTGLTGTKYHAFVDSTEQRIITRLKVDE